eukprot:CAMPEP_0179418338 /NCGR_PEP_ID=MMETSP0799-20121207/7933_1 /TAXON_ID=46947 /ORGANISM="Geminigera cryophila, Strain CCMP2564" /LENGTH=478 /DNA_ID=CAMNT_0021191579 /DNA_START=286 /DNA_END=1719 /DNA_ORIENTATION=+
MSGRDHAAVDYCSCAACTGTGFFEQPASGIHPSRTVPCRRCNETGRLQVKHTAPLLLLPKRQMISSQFDSAASWKFFGGGDLARFRVQNVRVALDPYNNAYEHKDFFCPILREIMENPYITPGGITYEYAAIRRWVEQKRSCPMTRNRLQLHQLKPNSALRLAIQKHIASGTPVQKTPAEWPCADQQHVKIVLVNYQDESHLHSFVQQHKGSVVEALGGMSFDVLPAEVVPFGLFSIHLQVEEGLHFSVKAMPPALRSLSKNDVALFRKLETSLSNMRIHVNPQGGGGGRSISLGVSAVYKSAITGIDATRNAVELVFVQEDELKSSNIKQASSYVRTHKPTAQTHTPPPQVPRATIIATPVAPPSTSLPEAFAPRTRPPQIKRTMVGEVEVIKEHFSIVYCSAQPQHEQQQYIHAKKANPLHLNVGQIVQVEQVWDESQAKWFVAKVFSKGSRVPPLHLAPRAVAAAQVTASKTDFW